MALADSDIGRLVALGAPILCADTCSVLDVMRDPTRDTTRPQDVQAAVELVEVMEANGPLMGLLAGQVLQEFDDNHKTVEDAANTTMERLIERVGRVNSIVGVFGVTGTVDLTHLAGHVIRARSVVDRWLAVATTVPRTAEIADRALSRMLSSQTPARKGKDSMKDCVVTETYLAAVHALRAAGLKSRIVFLSSNTEDYVDKAQGGLKGDLKAEFDALSVHYATNAAHARHLLQV